MATITKEELELLFSGLANEIGNNVGVYNVDKERKLLEKEDLVIKQILKEQEKLKKLGEYIIKRDEEEQGTHPDWSNLRKILGKNN